MRLKYLIEENTMNKKFLSLLIALVMTVQLLPLSLFASDEETETYISEETCSLADVSTADNDELFEGYVEQLFGISSDDGIMLTATYTGEDAFASDSLYLSVYNQLEDAVAKIASGEETSTIVTVSFSTDRTYTASTEEDAVQAFRDDCALILRYILNDYPYEMYWFDKTSYGIAVSYYNVSSTDSSYTIRPAGLYFYLTVASAYRDSDATTPTYTVNTSKVTAAKQAVANAQAIVKEYTEKYDTALGLLTAYEEYICSQVSYQTNYGNIYGDYWQLVYVFDGDDSTNVVCEGYSKAFQYLCDLSGLECITVTGYMGTSSLGGHMWNVVYLDGVNYLVDVTNTDGNGIGNKGDLFMVCADDASKILDGSEVTTYTLDGTETTAYHTGYAFLIGSTTVTYVYDDYSLALYPYESYLALGSKYYGRALTLDGEIGVTYYFQLSAVENPDDYYLMASIGTSSYQKYTAAESKTIDEITYCRYTVYVNPTQVESDIYAYLTNGSDTVSIDTFSVYDYCNTAITTTGWEAEKPVCEAVLNYAYYATVYAGSSSDLQNTLQSIDSTWSDPVSSIDVSSLSSYATSSDSVEKTLVLGSGVYIRVYVDDASATYTVDGEKLEVVTSGSTSYVEFKVYAKEMYKTFTVYKDGAKYTTYSVYRYIYNICSDSSSSETLTNLCKAIYDYGEKAKAYNKWL